MTFLSFLVLLLVIIDGPETSFLSVRADGFCSRSTREKLILDSRYFYKTTDNRNILRNYSNKRFTNVTIANLFQKGFFKRKRKKLSNAVKP